MLQHVQMQWNWVILLPVCRCLIHVTAWTLATRTGRFESFKTNWLGVYWDSLWAACTSSSEPKRPLHRADLEQIKKCKHNLFPMNSKKLSVIIIYKHAMLRSCNLKQQENFWLILILQLNWKLNQKQKTSFTRNNKSTVIALLYNTRHKRNRFIKEQTCEFESGLLQTHWSRKTLDSSKMLLFGSYLVFPAIGMTFSNKTERNSKIFWHLEITARSFEVSEETQLIQQDWR